MDPTSRRILVGLVVGTIAGVLVNTTGANVEWTIRYVAQPAGQIFLRLLLMVVVPLVFTTLVLGVANLGDLKRLGRMGTRTLVLFLATTTTATLLGLAIVHLVRPGNVISPELRNDLIASFESQASSAISAAGSGVSVGGFLDLIPANPVAAAAQGNLLAVIVFTLVFAVALLRIPREHAEPVLRVLDGVAQAVMVMIRFAMWIAPVGVAGLAYAVSAALGLDVLAPLGLYTLVVMVGLVIYQFAFLPALAHFGGGVGPRRFLRESRTPMLTAFSTASSSATLPTTIRAAEEGLGVPREVAGFVLPLGATMHMNGTAFFEAITIVFLAQAFGVVLGIAQLTTILVMVVLTAVAAAGIPSGSLPLIVAILAMVGVPGEALALMLGVEPLLGMMRTSTNVTGDLAASLVISRGESSG